MLLKSHITDIEVHSEEWHKMRLAKFTSSEWHNLMGTKWPTEVALSYVYKKCGEELTGISARDEVSTPATNHGLLYEGEAIRKYAESKGLKFVVVQKLITEPGSRFGSTPDFLIVHNESQDQLSYNVSTGEVKCPLSFNAYIELFLCNTPEDVKAVSKMYYWQVISQMDMCGALVGFLIVYHPDFKSGGMKVIEFKKINLVPEFKLVAERKVLAIQKFEEIRSKLLAA